MKNNNNRQPSLLVIGAGMTGILAAVKLQKAGINDVTILEKADKIGGTWRENTYPGVACDIPSHMYTYSFEPNPEWSEFFASGTEIQQYFERVADKYQIAKLCRFNEAVQSAHYENGKWRVVSAKQQTYLVDFVINATGILHHPSFPNIPGLEDFSGNLFHTARWDHSVAMDDSQSVGVIGTGSTAAQAIPELINTGAKVTVFQRTAQWILPISNFRFPNSIKKLAKRYSKVQYLLRKIPFLFMEHVFTKAVIGRFWQRSLVSFLCKTNLKLSVKNKALRKKLTPNYRVGCKRIIVNNTFYKAMQKSNSQLVTDDIEKISKHGVVTRDGKEHKFDTLVLATGFDPTAYMRPMELVGKNDLHINQAWRQDIKAYRSILLKDFPNFFLMLGPYTPIGNFSVIAMSEVQLDYIIKLINKWQDNEFDSVEPRDIAIENFAKHVKAGLSNTAWVSGCQSWYLDKNGDPILWPYTWQQWTAEMSEPSWSELQFNQY